MKRKFYIIINFLFLFIIILNTFSFGLSYLEIPVWNESNLSTEVSTLSSKKVITDKDLLSLESTSAILIEESTGNILYEKNPHEKLYPASTTKIMSILIIMDNIKEGKISFEDKVACSEEASNMGGSQIWLSTNETLTVHEMLKAICVVSANDCVYAMAEHIAGSEEAFVVLMNEKAKKLGMNNTTFKNCHGIDEKGHLTTAYDISLMARALITNHPEIKEYTTIWMDSLRNNESQLVNTNKLIRTYEGATGLKTGSTSLALYNLTASATRNNLSLISVILKAPSSEIRFKEAKLLLDFGFNKYTNKVLNNKDDFHSNIPISKGIKDSIDLIFEETTSVLIDKTNSNNIKSTININENISAPIYTNDILGKIDYKLNNNTISSVNLIANEDVPKKTFIKFTSELIKSYFNLL